MDRPKRGTQAEYERFVRRFDKRLMVLIRRLNRTGDTVEFGEGMVALLEQAHLGAAWRGRILAGDRRRIQDFDRSFAREIAATQADFLLDWLDQIDDGRYSDAAGFLNLAAMRQRGRYYLERLRGSANDAFLAASDAEEMFDWELGIAEHCEDCLELARYSPYRERELPTTPGRCQTACRTKCKCKLRRQSDGLAGFDFVNLYASEVIDLNPAQDREATG
jgi:hypothetical protein